MHQKVLFLYSAALVFTSSCSVNLASESLLSTPDFITATLPVTSAPLSTPAAIPPSPLPTRPPVEGTTTSQVYVRSEPATAGNNLGTIAPFAKVQILARESYGAWYQILYTNSADGKGWITAAYVQVDDPMEIPVIEVRSGSGSRVSGLALQTINVRSGPGTSFESLGTLSQNDVVAVSGKDSKGAWMQIDFKGGAGWAASEFLKVNDTDSLPVTADTTQTGAAEETAVNAVPSPTLPPSIQDDDSRQAPLASIQLSPSASRVFQFTGHVSSINGDAEDWLRFYSEGERIQVSAQCMGGDLSIELWNSEKLIAAHLVECKTRYSFSTYVEQDLFVRIQNALSNGYQLSSYTLKAEIISR